MLISEVSTPTTVVEAMSIIKRHPGSLVCAGGTSIMSETAERAVQLPPFVISLQRIQELRSLARTDRYIELGAMMTLTDLLELKESTIPDVLRESVTRMANFAIRNVATVGGAVMRRDRFLDPFPALACLDALAEIKTPSGSSWINVNRFVGDDGRPALPESALLTKIRVPTRAWDVSVSKKYGCIEYLGDKTAAFACICAMDKRAISEIRIMEAGMTAIRSREAETTLIGRRLPLSIRDKEIVAEAFDARCSELKLSPFRTERFQSVLSVLLDSLEHGAP